MAHVKGKSCVRPRSFYYKFRIIPAIATLFTLIILACLGMWQLDRAEQKKELLAQLQRKTNAPPQPLSQIPLANFTQQRFTKVQIRGEYCNQHTFLLDNQVFNKQAGYRVLTLFKPHDLDKGVLIDRGWIARKPTLPVIPQIQNPQEISGIINTIPSGLTLKPDNFDAKLPRPVILQAINYDLIMQYTKTPIYQFLIQLPAESQGAFYVAPIHFNVSVEKHIGYALQWFLFATLVLVYYVLLSVKKR